MIDTNKLLEQFLGGRTPGASAKAPDSNARFPAGAGGFGGNGFGGGGFAGGAAMGSILGLLVGNKKMRKMSGGLVGYGGAAALGALAHKAYQNWQQGNQVATAPVAAAADLETVDPRFVPGAGAGGDKLTLVLINAMIGAAKADGHIDAREQTAIFGQVEKLALDAESKAFIFDALHKPVDIAAVAAGVQGLEQATEVYLAARLIADGDNPAERMYMEALAHRLNIPAELVAHLEHQVVA